MKKVIWILIGILILFILGQVNKSLSDRMFEDCMSAGKQSEETCYSISHL